MRKALLIVALIGASFAGGAVVNGPGIQIAKGWLDRHLTNAAGQSSELAGEPGSIPAAPLPPLGDTSFDIGYAPLVSPPDAPGGSPAQPLAAAETAAKADLTTPSNLSFIPTEPAASPAATAAPVPMTAPATAPPKPPGGAQPPTAPAAGSGAAAPSGTVAAWNDAPDSSAPAHAILPGQGASGGEATADPSVGMTSTPPDARATPAPVSPDAVPSDPSDQDWEGVASRLRDLGVDRYWVEADFDGTVRMRCSIPLAGERAVTQQFEAEAGNLILAAENVISRIMLWRATENP